MAEQRDMPIRIEVTPQGIHVSVEFVGKLEQIPAALDRLRELGVLELVSRAPSPAPKAKAQRVQPLFDGNGDPMCPTHKRLLKQGQYGLYCSHKDRESGEFCKLKFEEGR